MEKLGLILSQFPETHETFILREFNGLKNKGLPFEIFSLKKCCDKIVHPEAKDLIASTHYASEFCLWSLAYCFFLNPAGFIKAFLFCVSKNYHSPMQFIKIGAVFLRAVFFARVMKRRKITHIHAHWATMPTTGAKVISMILNIPFSFTAHAWDIYLNKIDLKEKIHAAKFVVTCTNFNKVYLDKLCGTDESKVYQDKVCTAQASKVYLNYHGIDFKAFSKRSKPEQSKRFIFAIGRLVEQKGFEDLIEACALLQGRGLKVYCIIAGEGPLRKPLEGLCDQLGVAQIINMPGTVTQKQIKQWFSEATVFAAPSVIAKNGDRDGIPNVILEALALGVPVVASDVSGIPEIIIDQETGLLVPPHNAKALAKALERMLTTNVDQLVNNGCKKVEQLFNIERNVEELINIMKL